MMLFGYARERKSILRGIFSERSPMSMNNSVDHQLVCLLPIAQALQHAPIGLAWCDPVLHIDGDRACLFHDRRRESRASEAFAAEGCWRCEPAQRPFDASCLRRFKHVNKLLSAQIAYNILSIIIYAARCDLPCGKNAEIVAEPGRAATDDSRNDLLLAALFADPEVLNPAKPDVDTRKDGILYIAYPNRSLFPIVCGLTISFGCLQRKSLEQPSHLYIIFLTCQMF